MINEINKEIKKTIFSLVSAISIVVFFLVNSSKTIISSSNANSLAMLDSGKDVIEFIETSKPITLNNALPVKDEMGMQEESYTFEIKNNGNSKASLALVFEENIDSVTKDSCTNLPIENLKYYLVMDDKVISEAKEMMDEKLITFSLEPQETKHFEFKMWIKSSAGSKIMGMHLHRNFKVISN